MAKIKLTKGELKRQRDALRRYERYLPTLQLKKQQIQMEILHQTSILEAKRQKEAAARGAAEGWSGLLSDNRIDLRSWTAPLEVITSARNVAGVDLPIYEGTQFPPAEYDLFVMPLWVDSGLEELKSIVSLRQEMATIEKSVVILRQELRITTQRVNLFEKVKIPEAKEAIRLIKIFIGDQMANAVGRSKIAKRKIEAFVTAQTTGVPA
ncbi:MAG: V-type ATP synthase subunit D [Candidatus Omnitrophica bacterium]|nr:V-type ATP synthase subunit D [Candidatus Omnitrophota bacterium]